MSEQWLCFASVVFAIATSLSIIKVPEGYVAVYFRGGALLTYTDNPGYHAVFPIVTQTAFVQTSVQTDNVLNIPCGTSGGTMIHFARIEVVNQLARHMVYSTVKNYTVDYDKTWIYDKIHHEINQICSRSTLEEMYITKFDTLDETLRDALQYDIDAYSPGIQIIAIRVTKPSIPNAIRLNYEAIEAERTKHMVAVETRRVVEQNAQTEKRKAIIDAAPSSPTPSFALTSSPSRISLQSSQHSNKSGRGSGAPAAPAPAQWGDALPTYHAGCRRVHNPTPNNIDVRMRIRSYRRLCI